MHLTFLDSPSGHFWPSQAVQWEAASKPFFLSLKLLNGTRLYIVPTKSSACLVTSAFASSALAAVQLWGAFLLLHLYFGSPLATRNMCAKGSIKLNGSLENGSQGFWSLLRRTSTVWLQYYLAYTTVLATDFCMVLLVQLCQSVGPHFSSFLFLVFLFNFCTHFSNLNRFEKRTMILIKFLYFLI